MAPAAPSSIVRLSTRDVAPADRLSYASWILSSSLAPSALTTETPSEYELEVTALELPSIAIVAQSGSPQRSIRARPEIRRTAQRYCFLVLVVSGSWHVASLTRTRFGAGDLIFYDSRDPLDCDLLHNWNDLNLQLSEQFVRKWVPVLLFSLGGTSAANRSGDACSPATSPSWRLSSSCMPRCRKRY